MTPLKPVNWPKIALFVIGQSAFIQKFARPVGIPYFYTFKYL